VRNQEEFVNYCRNLYISQDFLPGDSEFGPWENAHYPEPVCRGGEKTILLLKHHHQIQGVLQSEEFGTKCFFSTHFDKCLKEIREEFSEEFVNFILDLKSKWSKFAANTNFKESWKTNGKRSRDEKTGRNETGTERSKQWRSKGASVANSQKWISTIDNFISTAAGVALHNKALGFPTSAKVRLEQASEALLGSLKKEDPDDVDLDF
jgi:hypothetical protein